MAKARNTYHHKLHLMQWPLSSSLSSGAEILQMPLVVVKLNLVDTMPAICWGQTWTYHQWSLRSPTIMGRWWPLNFTGCVWVCQCYVQMNSVALRNVVPVPPKRCICCMFCLLMNYFPENNNSMDKSFCRESKQHFRFCSVWFGVLLIILFALRMSLMWGRQKNTFVKRLKCHTELPWIRRWKEEQKGRKNVPARI